MINASPSNSRSLYSGPRYLFLAVFIVVGALLAVPLFIGSASSPTTPIDRNLITHKLDNSTLSSPESVVFRNFNFLMPQAMPPTVETFAGNCTDPKTVFNVQDTDLTVCAKFTGAAPGWRVIWSNARFISVQSTVITAANGTATFTLNANSSLGDWRVILFEPIGGTVQAITSFTVVDETNPTADLTVSKSAISGTASSGGQAIFSIQVTNNGPSAASSVSLSDDIPANTTFLSFDQLGGPTFTCNSPAVGETGSTVCTITSLGRGETAFFLATYQIGTVPNGTLISNTATVTSTTTDPPNPDGGDNNTSTATVDVLNTPCQLSTQENITVSADPGQAGAVVTYTTPTGTGDCGTDTTGEGGETIPAISCNPPSGSFFPAGTTTVICTAQTGAATSFLVTVDNPGALSISLNGANTLTLECGQRFADPGATAINGSGQSIDVTVTYSGDFNPEAPTVGTYTATYTATEDPNSVSTTRTLNVTDTEGPAITVDGANPYRIQQGSCLPFIDPGATAFDSCAGPKPVTTTVSGPGGATSVNTGIAGTYTVTYTATDGTNESTATRTVVVGTFPPDEVDQPSGADVPPTITLNGDDQITLECGTPFTDPGVTASVCGGSVPVTTTGSVDIHTPGTYTITYSATANGHTAEATRIVVIEDDNSPPVITLNGANPMTVECHTSFTDPGATANDACAGNLAVTTSGAVDVNTPGTYVITYTATDTTGHTTTATRTVNVVDTTPPILSCPSDIVASFDPAVNGAVVNYTAPVGTDSCSTATTTQIAGLASGSTFPVGTTTNTFEATDTAGNKTQCSFKVTIALTSIIGLDTVSIGGSGFVDSYSSAGGYPATKGSLANILSNGTITLTNSGKVWGNVRSTRVGINLSGATQVTGNATAGTTVSTSGSATIGGTVTNNQLAPVMSLPSVPDCGSFSPNNGISGNYSYNPTTGNLSLSGTNIATLANGTYCFHNLSLTNSAQLKINGPVVIKLTGTLNAGGATSLTNTTNNPGNLRILSSYTGTNGVSFTNSTSAHLIIYAPRTGVTVSGAAPLLGFVAGKSVTISNSGQIHFDTQLTNVWGDVWALIFGP